MAVQSINAARYESGSDRTFDWRMAIVRDSGVYLKSNTTFYIHHRKFGAIGRENVRRASVLQALAMLRELAEKEEAEKRLDAALP